MSELLHNLGINWKILAAQIINFAILLFILQRFLYKPLIGMLNKRREEIKKAAEHVESVEKRLKEIESAKETVLAEARDASQKLIKKAEADAVSAAERITTEARADAKRFSAEERKKLAFEREKLIQEVKGHIGEVVAAAVEKSVADVVDEKARKHLLDQALEMVRTSKHS